jgi:hypothetical protein
LPQHLQVSILQATDACLEEVFACVPVTMHLQALCAKFPSITSSLSLRLHGTSLSSASSIHVLDLAGNFSSLTSLKLTDVDTGAFASSIVDDGCREQAFAGEICDDLSIF